MDNGKSKVAVLGGSNVDLKGYPEGEYLPRTSNPGKVIERLGGVGRNIAENLGLLDVSTSLLTAVGDDHYGRELVRKTEKPSLDLSRVLRSPDKATGRYLVVNDEAGELVGAVSDMAVMDEVTGDYLEENRDLLRDSEVVALDSNPEKGALGKLFAILEETEDATVVADPVSVAKSDKLKRYLGRLDVITPSEAEALSLFQPDGRPSLAGEELAVKVRDSLRELGLKVSVVITSGAEGATLVNGSGIYRFDAVSVPEEKMGDTTGAGDSLTAALIYALLEGRTMKDGVRLGVKAAAASIQSRRTVNPKLKSKIEG